MQEDLQPNCDVLSDMQPAVKGIYVPDQQNLLQHIATQLPLLQQLSLHANWGHCRPLQLEQLAALSTSLHCTSICLPTYPVFVWCQQLVCQILSGMNGLTQEKQGCSFKWQLSS